MDTRLAGITNYFLLNELQSEVTGQPRDYLADIKGYIRSLEEGAINPDCFMRSINDAMKAGGINYEQIGRSEEQLEDLVQRNKEMSQVSAARSIPVGNVISISSGSPADGAFYGHGIG